jgi:LysM repeat protein
MLLPAIGVWFGGWVDNLIQRLTEVNMVLPSLTIAVLTNVLFGLDIWIILGIVVVVNAFGSPIKILRAALLQAKEAPYIETARSYGASDLRIIMRYLVPRILPVLIPQLVTQVPSFIFWEATLGLFNIKSTYPSWGRIIYEGLAQGALYGSPFWVLEPISLLLLTSFAFAMLGSALERILNPRMLEQVPARADKPRRKADETNLRPLIRWVIAVSVVLLLIAAILIPSKGKEFTNVVMDYVVPAEASDSAPTVAMPVVAPSALPLPPVSSATDMPDSGLRDSPAPTPTPLTAPLNPATLTLIVPQSVLTLLPVNSRPVTYVLRAGEFPYCIARRFNVNPIELLTLNGLTGKRIFYAGTVLKIPQTGNPFPGERMLRVHPTTYRVSTADGTVCSVACEFGDIDPQVIADANHVSVEAVLLIGRELTIP